MEAAVEGELQQGPLDDDTTVSLHFLLFIYFILEIC